MEKETPTPHIIKSGNGEDPFLTPGAGISEASDGIAVPELSLESTVEAADPRPTSITADDIARESLRPMSGNTIEKPEFVPELEPEVTPGEVSPVTPPTRQVMPPDARQLGH